MELLAMKSRFIDMELFALKSRFIDMDLFPLKRGLRTWSCSWSKLNRFLVIKSEFLVINII